MRLRSRSAGMCVAGWPGERPDRRLSWSNPSRLSRLRSVVADTFRMRTAWAALDCGSDEQVSGAGRSRAGPGLPPARLGTWLGLGCRQNASPHNLPNTINSPLPLGLVLGALPLRRWAAGYRPRCGAAVEAPGSPK